MSKKYLNATEVAKEFKISASKLNNIFSNLNWIKKENKWWIVTELGKEAGAKQEFNLKNKMKYVKWEESIKENNELIEAIKKEKNLKLSNKEKGDIYEAFIAEHYRKLGFFVLEHGKEKGRKDKGIDLIVKSKEEIFFIQCKNWKENTRFKIDHKEVKATRMEATDFIEENPIFQGYKNKIRYTLSGDFIHLSAIKYIEEHNEILDYEIIKMNI